ncbi:ATP grasp domain [Trypanosoma vivax]|nr:ATP grasp domain [Trypanosoma vivax]
MNTGKSVSGTAAIAFANNTNATSGASSVTVTSSTAGHHSTSGGGAVKAVAFPHAAVANGSVPGASKVLVTHGPRNKRSVAIAAKRAATRKKTQLIQNRSSGGASSTQPMVSAVASPAASNSMSLPPPRAIVPDRHLNKKLSEKKKKIKKIRVCVLNSSYKGTDSITAKVDNYHCSPAYRVQDKKRYTFTEVCVQKDDSYRQVRQLVTSNNYDVFFNLCDGGRDEKRAGVDVLEALEEHNAAFTGPDSRGFEPNKIDMKLLVAAAGVNTPNFVLLECTEGMAKKCRHLRFPVIVKHISGYASVGISEDSRCDNLEELKVKVSTFLKEFNHALVEEFIRGREGTVLACADSGSLHSIKVFKPLMFNFLQNDDDFAYFEKKWGMECNNKTYKFLPNSDPSYPQIMDMARNAFQYIMNGVGYGRVDFRIDQKGDVYFLEINPNCGMWYSEKDGGDFADLMVEEDKSWDHDRFVRNAVVRAMREQTARRPWYCISHDSRGSFSTRASRTVRAGKALFSDATHEVPVIAQALYKLGEENPTVGCVITRGDRLNKSVAIRHSCEPNMQFMQGRTLTLVAKRKINAGEELTLDYATLCDERMPTFTCSCGTSECRGVIFPSPPTPRTLEGRGVRQMLRQKKLAWYKEKEDREAERILKKRASRRRSGTASSTSSSTSHVQPALVSLPSSGTTAGPSSASGSSNSATSPTFSEFSTKAVGRRHSHR